MSHKSSLNINLFSLTPPIKTLHITWLAFFISFAVWFNHAPLIGQIRQSLGLDDQQIKILLILNVALTIPARIIIGMLVDRFGPRITFASLLLVGGQICIVFSLSNSFEMLAITRFLLGFVGAGFVIGIRMISEWFPARQVGLAEGIYGGWGNFGSAAAAIALPSIALLVGGDDGWRYATAMTGIIAILYGLFYFIVARDTPKGATYFKPKKSGAMEVTSNNDFILYVIMKAPLFMALGLLTWKLGSSNLAMIDGWIEIATYSGLVLLYIYQVFHIYQVNKQVFTKPVAKIHQYDFKQVAVLNLAYMVTFGSELAVISMLPLFFIDTFALSPVLAGILASGFAFMNLIARPGGGFFSDRFGRRKSLTILLTGSTIGYLLLSQIDGSTPLFLAVILIMFCSFFVQAGEGAVFSIVPLVKRRLTGQIAGMVGAYGNVGAVFFLTVLSFVAPTAFFITIACATALTIIAVWFFLKDPDGQIAEILPDGTVELIDVG